MVHVLLIKLLHSPPHHYRLYSFFFFFGGGGAMVYEWLCNIGFKHINQLRVKEKKY